MAGCESCGGTQVFRKTNVVMEVGKGGSGMMVTRAGQKFVSFTMDICGGCGRTVMFVENPHDWLARVGYDAVYDTSQAPGG